MGTAIEQSQLEEKKKSHVILIVIVAGFMEVRSFIFVYLIL